MKAATNNYEFDINLHEKTIYSQHGEDGIIEFIFSRVKTTNKFFVEFGVGDGFQCNTIYLLEKKGWKGLRMDYNLSKNIKKDVAFLKKIKQFKHSRNSKFDIKNEKVTAENIQDLFQKYNVPKNFDLLSIDIDFNDYWVWKAIVNYFPRVVVIEFNSSIPPNVSKVVPYDPDARWDRTNYFGASLLALQKLGLTKGYTLVGCNNQGVNAFFCKSELIKGISVKGIQNLYKSPKYGQVVNDVHIGHPPSDKKMIEI